LYEKIAPLDKSLAAWHWKEAATAWLKAGETAKSLAAAKKSDGSSPEKRSQMLTHFWHRGLGEVFLATGEKELATGHFERAIENTTIDGYLNDCRELLRQAKQR
jgi:tetratricopeptide (TPR) repeat protein